MPAMGDRACEQKATERGVSVANRPMRALNHCRSVSTQRDRRHRRLADVTGEQRQVVERGLGLGVEDVHLPQRRRGAPLHGRDRRRRARPAPAHSRAGLAFEKLATASASESNMRNTVDQFADLEQVQAPRSHVQQSHVPALAAEADELRNQHADPATVDVTDVPEVEDDLQSSLADQAAEAVPEHGVALLQNEPALQIEDGDVAEVPFGQSHARIIGHGRAAV